MKKMMQIFKENNNSLYFIIFMILFVFWGFLISNTKMIVAYDAVSYEKIGKTIYQEGLMSYFRDGPNREPLYCFTIATSMYIGNVFKVDYRYIQASFQILMLFLTQIFLLRDLINMRHS